MSPGSSVMQNAAGVTGVAAIAIGAFWLVSSAELTKSRPRPRASEADPQSVALSGAAVSALFTLMTAAFAVA